MVNLNLYQGLGDYLNDVANVPFAVGPSNGNAKDFARERTRRNYEFGMVIQRYLSAERILLEKIEGLEEKTETGASLNVSEEHTNGNVRRYERELKTARRVLEEHKRDNKPAYIKAKHGLTESCLLLVVNWAKKYAETSGLDFMDLVGYGNKGLMHAADKFDPKRKCQFSTYASWWIRQSISRGIVYEEAKSDLSVAYPTYKKRGRVLKIEELLVLELGRNPEDDEVVRKYNELHGLSSEGKISVQHVKLIRNLRPVARLSSLGFRNKEDSEFDVEDRVSEDSRQIAGRNEKFMAVLDYLDNSGNFTLAQREVLKCRFGLGGRTESTLKEIGIMLGLSRERIRQVESKAIHKLRYHFDPMYRHSSEGQETTRRKKKKKN